MTGVEFWSLSWVEWTAASTGFVEFHSGGKKAGPKRPSKKEAADITRRAEEMLKRQGKL